MQHINLKIFAASAEGVKLADAIPVFHRWIQAHARPEMLIDVADYSHVPGGPGVLLIGHEAIYGLDLGHNRLGLLYSRKASGGGTPQERLRQAYEAAHDACRMLEQEPEFRGKLAFREDEVELVLNDRLLYPNTEETWLSVRGEIERFFDDLYGEGRYTITRDTDPRERFRMNVHRKE